MDAAQWSREQERGLGVESNVLTSPGGLCVSTSASGLGIRKLLITIMTSAAITKHLLGDIHHVSTFSHMDFFAPHNLSSRYYCLTSFTHEEAIFRDAKDLFQKVRKRRDPSSNSGLTDANTLPQPQVYLLGLL